MENIENKKSRLTKRDLEHLASLARIELNDAEKEKLLIDLGKILGHFEELKELDTSNIPPMTGGSELKNIFRSDDVMKNAGQEADIKDFPDSENGFLKVPPVFE